MLEQEKKNEAFLISEVIPEEQINKRSVEAAKNEEDDDEEIGILR